MATSEITTAKFMGLVDVRGADECWNWTGPKYPAGYGKFRIAGQSSANGAHRASYALFVGPIPAGLFVCHHCDNKACVNPAHLYAGTARDNARDTRDRGRILRPRANHGIANGRATLTEQDVAVITSAEYRRGGMRHIDMAERLGVTLLAVRNVIYGKTWRHITGRRRACEAA